jgi:DNA-directed RNA polymerase I, II, and III subunit RPABC1
MQENKISHCIIIHNGSPTSAVNEAIKKSRDMDPPIVVELFDQDDLQYNITKHYLVPEHIALSDTDRKAFVKEYGTLIPYISKSDPISRFYGYNSGDVIMVKRDDNVVGYRIVR